MDRLAVVVTGERFAFIHGLQQFVMKVMPVDEVPGIGSEEYCSCSVCGDFFVEKDIWLDIPSGLFRCPNYEEYGCPGFGLGRDIQRDESK